MSMPVQLDLDLQLAIDGMDVPAREDFIRWVSSALDGRLDQAELTLRVVDEQEGRALNLSYRGQDKATNVLSFPFDPPPGIEPDHPIRALLGDIVICAPVVRAQALEQGKPQDAHWAHLVIHGVLHLIGFDHLSEAEASEMETLETAILDGLGFPPPYETDSIPYDQRPI